MEEKINKRNRHDFIILKPEGKKRIYQEMLLDKSNELQQLPKEFKLNKENFTVPGIVRRVETSTESFIPVGFVPCGRVKGNRIRFGSFINVNEIEKIVTPFEVLEQFTIPARNSCMDAVKEILALSNLEKIPLGILGSAGLELITNLPYTDDNSDLDLLVKSNSYEILHNIFLVLQQIGRDYSRRIDLEIMLPNGYGIKAAELFMDTKTILGKSLFDVKLFKKTKILVLLKKEKL